MEEEEGRGQRAEEEEEEETEEVAEVEAEAEAKAEEELREGHCVIRGFGLYSAWAHKHKDETYEKIKT